MFPSSPLATPNSRCIRNSPKISANFSMSECLEISRIIRLINYRYCITTPHYEQTVATSKSVTLLNSVFEVWHKIVLPFQKSEKKHCGAITFPPKSVTSMFLCHAFKRKTCCSASTFFENLGFRIQRPYPFQNPGLKVWHFHRSFHHSQMSDEIGFSDS